MSPPELKSFTAEEPWHTCGKLIQKIVKNRIEIAVIIEIQEVAFPTRA